MKLCRVSQIVKKRVWGRPTSKEDRSKLWKLAEELSIPTKELNKLAKEVVGREFGTVAKLTVTENRKFRGWLQANRIDLGERYRKLIWNQRLQQ